MPDKLLFEYAVIRLVPRVEREEFINAGIVMYVRSKRFIWVKIGVNEQRLQALAPVTELSVIKEYLLAFERICNAATGCGPIGKLDAASRFRWLTATRSTIVQTSKVHPGFCDDPQDTLQKLFDQLVL